MAAKKNGDTGEPKAQLRVAFNYLKAHQYRSIHVDGAAASVTPNGHIALTAFNERVHIPRKIVHEVTPTGQLGAEVLEERESLQGLIRELEISLYMDVATAKQVAELLSAKIQEAGQQQRAKK